MSQWTNVKPVQPGMYLRRSLTDDTYSEPEMVSVSKVGRGLRVTLHGSDVSVAMSLIYRGDFQWKMVSQ